MMHENKCEQSDNHQANDRTAENTEWDFERVKSITQKCKVNSINWKLSETNSSSCALINWHLNTEWRRVILLLFFGTLGLLPLLLLVYQFYAPIYYYYLFKYVHYVLLLLVGSFFSLALVVALLCGAVWQNWILWCRSKLCGFRVEKKRCNTIFSCNNFTQTRCPTVIFVFKKEKEKEEHWMHSVMYMYG